MNKDNVQPDDAKLTGLLRSTRPRAELPPGFRDAVWRRIEKVDERSVGLMERFAQWFLTPRLAAAGLTLVVLMAAGAGALRGIHSGEKEARDRYVASVDPAYPRP